MKYVNRLTREQEKELLELMHFSMFQTGFCRGSERYVTSDEIVFHSYDHDHRSSKDYEDYYLYLGDFEVKRTLYPKDHTKDLRKYLYNLFGEEYKEDLKLHLQAKKEEIMKKAHEIDEEIEDVK